MMPSMVTKSSYNQLANTKNPYQGKATKALCVCSAGLLRSPSIAKFLTEKEYNTRACGMSQEYALIPISEALIHWADEFHVVEEQRKALTACVVKVLGEDHGKKIIPYNIPDMYQTFNKELMKMIKEDYNAS